jgi:hypothetical protein
MTELERRTVTELADWAAEDGDPDVVEVCKRALEGDVQMLAEALAWWPAWAWSRKSGAP